MLRKKFFVITICIILIFPEISRAQDSASDLINNFAFKIGDVIAENSDGNFFISPFGIIQALGIIQNASSGDMPKELENILKINHEINSEINNILNELMNDKILFVANRFWINSDEKKYIISDKYKNSTEILNFRRNQQLSTNKINDWITENTGGRIKNFISNLNFYVKMIFTNTAYFNYRWQKSFESKFTMMKNFNVPNSRGVVPTMRQNNDFKYCEIGNNKIISLPHDNYRTSMIIILPADGNLNIFKNMTSEKFSSWLKALNYRSVDLWLPKFNFEIRYELSNLLNNLGIKKIFSDEANFSEITGVDMKLKINSFMQQTFIEIGEMSNSILSKKNNYVPMYQRAEFHADRPFMYFIFDEISGCILFLGRQTFK